MRRSDREEKDQTVINDIINRSTVCRLGMVDGDKPYVVPVCFGYDGKCIYIHGALVGRKIDVMKKNSNICFEIDLIADPIASENACDWGMKYQSIIGFGIAIFLEGPDEKRQALDIIMAQYSDKQYQYPDNMLKATAVIKIEIENITCKQCGI